MQRRFVTLGLVVGSTVLSMMGTDLILPAVPHLPELLGGNASLAQLVVAAYFWGVCFGLLAYGALGDRIATGRLFVASLLGTAVLSLGCSLAPTMWMLIGLRGVQGFVAAGPAVFATGIIKAAFEERSAVRAIGVIASIESLGPAVAPIVGAGLLALGGWRISFDLMAGLALLLALGMIVNGGVPQVGRRSKGSFVALLRDRVFLRYGVSQAAVVGGLIIFVVGMPTVFVRVNGGTLSDFVMMQVCGVVSFMIAANVATAAATRFGAERVITVGTALAAAGAFAQFAYALAGGTSAIVIAALFVPLNAGLGVRGPSAFYRAILASHGDDARASALVVLFMLVGGAVGTAFVSPWIERGSVPVSGMALAFQLLAVLCIVLLPRLRDPEVPQGEDGLSPSCAS